MVIIFSFFKTFPEHVVVELHMYYYRTFGLELLSELPRRVNSDLRLEVLILRSCWGVTFLLLLLPVFIIFLSELARVTEATLNTPSLYFTGLLSFSRGINSLPPQLSTLMFGKEFSRVNIRFFTAWMWRLWWRDTFLWWETNNQVWFLDFLESRCWLLPHDNRIFQIPCTASCPQLRTFGQIHQEDSSSVGAGRLEEVEESSLFYPEQRVREREVWP